MKLSVESARALLPGKSISDHIITGLELRSQRGTFKVWSYRYRFAGKAKRFRLGLFPTLGVDAAREAAKVIAQRVARGEDPASARSTLREAPTVADLAKGFLAEFAANVKAGTRQQTTFDFYRIHVEQHIAPALGSKRVAEITLADVNATLRRSQATAAARGKAGRHTYNNTRATLSAMFEFARHSDRKWRDDNPVADAQKVPTFSRRRKVEKDEFESIERELNRLQEEWPRQVAAIWVVVLAGTRVTELLAAKKSERVGSVILRRRHKSQRTGEEREIVLPRQACEIIDALPDDGSAYIFGRGLTRENPHLTRHNIDDVWNMAREAAGLPDLQVRDLRRTFASVGDSIGVSDEGVGKLLGHKDAKTTKIYKRTYAEVATATAQAIGDAVAARFRRPPAKEAAE